MSLFSKMKTQGHEKSEDRLGGAAAALNTDIHTGKLKQFYATKSSGGADAINLIVDFDGKDYRETVYISNKQGENFYPVKDKNKKPVLNDDGTPKTALLPGFIIINDICLATVGKELSELDFEEKMVNVYDFDAKKEMAKSVPVAVELLGETVSLAIVKTLENKTKKEGSEYVALPETREVNSIEKVFNTETKLTVNEAEAELSEPAFWPAWLEKNQGKMREKLTYNAGGATAGRPGSRAPSGPPTSGGGNEGASKKSLFGNKAA